MRLNAYGLAVDCDVALPGLPSAPGTGPADLSVVAGRPLGWTGAIGASAERRVDGRTFTVERGARGDLLMRWGEEGVFHLAGRTLTAWAAGDPNARWRRVLLDSALAVCALALGAEALHAGAVELDGGAVAVAAGQGGGKSSLVAELVAGGHRLLADDVVTVDAALLAHPAPPVLTLALDRPTGSALPADLGRVVAELDGEAWIVVERAATAALPLRAVIVLERAPGPAAPVLAEVASPLAVLPFLLDSGAAPERVAARFDRAAGIAASAPLLRLRAPLGCPPAQLAAAVRDAVGEATVSR